MGVLYTVIIFPLVTMIEIVYRAMESFLRDTGLSILGVSIAVNVLCLPVYAVAEYWQNVERETQRKLKPGIDRIKSAFRGDERFMILSTFYRQNGYHPIYALRSTFGLLIQIPFFIAAYKVLTSIPYLQGRSFLFIPDLGTPDALLKIGALSINVLPLIMTAINLVASAVYTKGFSLKEKIQLYAVAAIFCVLLYNSPSGLVFYWTLNNVFSLVKNILYKMKNPKKLAWMLMIAVMTFMTAGVFIRASSTRQRIFVIAMLVAVSVIPLVFKLFTKYIDSTQNAIDRYRGNAGLVFFLSCAGIALLAGLVIPGTLIASSPAEFAFTARYDNPVMLMLDLAIKSFGCFIFWPACLFLLFSGRVRTGFAVASVIFLAILILNAFAFQGDYGTLSPSLTFDDPNALKRSVLPVHLDLILTAVVCLTIALIFLKTGTKILAPLCAVMVLAFLALTAFNIYRTNEGYLAIRNEHEKDVKSRSSINSIYRFSKKEKNVLVIMIDRAIGSYVGEIMNEFPDLKDSMSGFVWYPDTFSFGGHTIMGAPALFGGYEYSPKAINARKNETLLSKLNESCTVLPRFFSASGWETTVSDLPYDECEKFPGIRKFSTHGMFADQWLRDHRMTDMLTDIQGASSLPRKMMMFSFLKMSPSFMRWTIYDMGGYWQLLDDNQKKYEFLNDYATLDYLGKITSFAEDKPCFNMLVNDTTHDTPFLQYPGYTFENTTTNIGPKHFNGTVSTQIYHANAAAFRALGRYMQFLKSNGVYDNTRIIIVSDHGFKSIGFDDKSRFPGNFKDDSFKVSYYNPVLLVKDFGASGPLHSDTSFMSNADVPNIATSGGLVPNPANPYTGKTFASTTNKTDIHLSANHNGRLVDHDNNEFRIPDDLWITLTGSIMDEKNWHWEHTK